MTYDELLKISMAEFERSIEHQVARVFDALPNDTRETPWTGEEFFPCQRADLKRRAIRALCAQKWFTHEAPAWAQPLPLRFEDCIALFNGVNQGNRRPRLVGEYGIALRAMGWNLQHAVPFEVFCAHALVPPPSG
jgi:hypothetical protein